MSPKNAQISTKTKFCPKFQQGTQKMVVFFCIGNSCNNSELFHHHFLVFFSWLSPRFPQTTQAEPRKVQLSSGHEMTFETNELLVGDMTKTPWDLDYFN